MTVDSDTLNSPAPATGSATDAATRSALDRVDAIGYPTTRDEAWRYAPIRLLGQLAFGPSPASVALPELDAQIPTIDGPRIVVVNGTVVAERSNLTCPDGMSLSSIADVLADRPDTLAEHFEITGDRIDDAYVALNIAYGVDGAVVEIADGVDLDVPIHIVDITDVAGLDETQNSSCTGVVIHVGAGSSATVVETRVGVGEQFGGSNTRTTVTLGSGATLDHVLLQDLPAAQVHLSRVDVTQAANSTFNARSFNLGAAYGRVAYDVTLGGAGSVADLSGLYLGFGEQILDQQISVVHAAENCTSRQSYRGVLDDRSTGVFNGGIDVRPGADGTDAEQSNDNLVLSDRAEANTQPRLEILADEVKCKHGATVGQLDDTALYYLRTRGIAADEARRLLINGFADQVVDGVGIESVRAWIIERLGHSDD